MSWGSKARSGDDDSHTYTRKLEKYLGQRGVTVEAKNFALRAAGPGIPFICLESMLEGFEPDIFILEFSINGGWCGGVAGTHFDCARRDVAQACELGLVCYKQAFVYMYLLDTAHSLHACLR